MSEWRYRLRRLVFGPPHWSTYTPADREALQQVLALQDEQPQPLPTSPITLASGRVVHRVLPVDGLAAEVMFRRYARRSGEVVR